MQWVNAVITNSGVALLAQSAAGGTLIFTGTGLGGGTVDAAALMAQTSLKNPLSVPSGITEIEDIIKGILLHIQIHNIGVLKTQRMKQVGIFAKIGDGTPVLFAIIQDETGEEIPSESEYADFLIELSAAIAVNNTGSIEITVSSNVFVTVEEFNKALNKKAEKIHTHTIGQLTDFPEALPADGGNADTVNNKSTMDIMNMGNVAQNRALIEDYSDINALVNGGKFYVDDSSSASTMQNSPFVDTGYYLDVLYRTSSFLTQIAMSWSGKIKVRNYNGAKWSDWALINDGGNAATLENHPASEFALKTDIPESLPANGGNAATLENHPASDFALKSDIPESLPANGGNADTVNNKSPVDIMNMGNAAQNRALIADNSDINTLVNGGKFYVSDGSSASTMQNSPFVDTGYYLDVLYRTSSFLTQIAMAWSGKIKVRNYNGAKWSDWTLINDGGNAATLENHPASDFALITDIPTSLPANGGNAATLENHPASEFALKTDIPESLPANGGNAATLENHPASDFAFKSDIPTSLPANGGNADTVNNKSPVDIMNMGNAAQNRALISDNSDINTLVNGGKFYVSDGSSASTIKNSPFGDTGYYMDVLYRSKTLSTQIAMAWSGKIKVRNYNGAKWSDWALINDGGNAATINGYMVNSDVPADFIPSIHFAGDSSFYGVSTHYSAISLEWAAVEGAVKYHIQKQNGTSWESIAYPEGTAYAVTGLEADTEYKFRFLFTADGTNWSAPKEITIRTPKNIAYNSSAPSIRPLFSGSAEPALVDIPSGSWYGQFI